jgi:hypothetical protein
MTPPLHCFTLPLVTCLLLSPLAAFGPSVAQAATDSSAPSVPVVAGQVERVDYRDWNNGTTMFGDGTTTVDQPYVVILSNGRWLAIATTRETEGLPCNLSVWWSDDKGKTWTWKKSVVIDKTSAWATTYLTSYGRIYAFYQTYDRIARFSAEWAFKYSDDNGETWSERHLIPTRLTEIDGTRGWWTGWSIDKPKLFRNQLFMAYTKHRTKDKQTTDYTEGWYLVCTSNIETEKDVGKLTWETRPDGMVGLRDYDLSKTVSAEFNTVPLSEALYCTARSYSGYILDSYSFDQGKTWSKMKPAPYDPEFPARIIKNPMANCNMWKCQNGKYLMWFHNQASGGESKMKYFPWAKESGLRYPNRNPVWITGGIEKNNKIYWSEPEILLYDADYAKFYVPHKQYKSVVGGFSYADLIEADGKYWFTETEKTFARLHPVDPSLLEGLWNPGATMAETKKAVILEMKDIPVGGTSAKAPVIPNLSSCGFAIETVVSFDDLSPGQVLLDTRQESKGILIATDSNQVVTISIGDGKITNYWSLDKDLLKPNTDHHIVFVVDGGPDVISVIVDGRLCDGGKNGRQGWGRFSRELLNVNGAAEMQVAASGTLKMKRLRIYNRYLRTSEAVGRYRNPEDSPAAATK